MSETRFFYEFVGPFFICCYKLHDIVLEVFEVMIFLKSRIQTSQDTLKQHFYCFKFLLLVQVAGIFFVLKILTFVVVLFFSSFLIQPLLSSWLLILYGEKVVLALAVVVSLATCSNVFALLTPILENSFTLSLAI